MANSGGRFSSPLIPLDCVVLRIPEVGGDSIINRCGGPYRWRGYGSMDRRRRPWHDSKRRYKDCRVLLWVPEDE